jgi:hypothetical protein
MVPPFRLTKSRLDPSGAQTMPVSSDPTLAKVLSLKLGSSVTPWSVDPPQPAAASNNIKRWRIVISFVGERH